MIRFSFTKSFDKSLKDFHTREKIFIQREIDSFMLAIDAGQIPQGFGLTKLSGDLWECRADIRTRVLFYRKKNAIIFLFVGNHHEVEQFLRHYIS